MNKTLVFAGSKPASTIATAARRGDLVQVARGVYSTEVAREPAEIVRSHWAEIVGHIVPDAVITDRSARTGGIVEGVLYLVHAKAARDVLLPGLLVRVRAGAGPLSSDIPYAGGLHLASPARALAENCLPSRASRSRARRTFDSVELGDWIDSLCQTHDTEKLLQLRREAEEIAAQIGIESDLLKPMQDAVGVALGTRDSAQTSSPVLRSRAYGSPIDQPRLARFESLIRALRAAPPQSKPEESVPSQTGRTRYLPFFEAYFSNFIEGTEFEVDDAAEIVFEGVIPADRPQEAHDILGTYRVVADPDGMARRGADAEEFVELLKQRHRSIMEGRPDKRPGEFKTKNNRAGSTHFVQWDLAEGTLLAGIRKRDELDTAWERAIYTAFVVSEVHPFDDGNGRAARVAMNAELAAAGQSRIIVPTVFRQDYLDGLRLLSRSDQPDVYIKAMRYAHDFTHSVDFYEYEEAKSLLAKANAFDEPDSANRLLVLERRRPWE